MYLSSTLFIFELLNVLSIGLTISATKIWIDSDSAYLDTKAIKRALLTLIVFIAAHIFLAIECNILPAIFITLLDLIGLCLMMSGIFGLFTRFYDKLPLYPAIIKLISSITIYAITGTALYWLEHNIPLLAISRPLYVVTAGLFLAGIKACVTVTTTTNDDFDVDREMVGLQMALRWVGAILCGISIAMIQFCI